MNPSFMLNYFMSMIGKKGRHEEYINEETYRFINSLYYLYHNKCLLSFSSKLSKPREMHWSNSWAKHLCLLVIHFICTLCGNRASFIPLCRKGVRRSIWQTLLLIIRSHIYRY